MVLGICCFHGMAGSMRVRNLLEPLLEKKIISVYNLFDLKMCPENIPFTGIINEIGYKVIRSQPKNIFSIIKFYCSGFRFLQLNKKSQAKNILYNYSTPDIKNILFILYAKLIGYKVIIDVTEDNRYKTRYASFLERIRVKSSFYLLKKLSLFADAVLVISTYLEQRISSISKGKIPVILVPISVNFKYFKGPNKWNDKREIKIFYGGSFGQKDGLEFLIQAFDIVAYNFDNIRLVLTGKEYDDFDFKNIMSFINNANNRSQIEYKGFLETEAYYKLLNDCDIFCMTRNNTKFANAGFPFKLGEFLATGKVVISTDVGDISKYLKNGINCILIKPESVDEIVTALNYSINNYSKMESIGNQARRTAEDNFNSDILSQKLYEIFNFI